MPAVNQRWLYTHMKDDIVMRMYRGIYLGLVIAGLIGLVVKTGGCSETRDPLQGSHIPSEVHAPSH